MRTNLTVLVTTDGQRIGVEEEGAEVIRQIQKFIKGLDVERKDPEFLVFTNPKKVGSRKLYLHQDVVRSITIVNEAVDEEESPITKPELVRAN